MTKQIHLLTGWLIKTLTNLMEVITEQMLNHATAMSKIETPLDETMATIL